MTMNIHANKGFGTLFTVIILASIGISLALWVSTGSVWSIRNSSGTRYSTQARAMADSCAEHALELVRENHSFSGSGQITIGSATCSYAVVPSGVVPKTIDTSSTVYGVTRKVRVQTSGFNPITVTSWLDAQ